MYDGVARKSAPYLFLGQTTSLCETCLGLVPAKIVEEDGGIYYSKRCPEHGVMKTLVSDDPVYWRRTLEYLKPGDRPLAPFTRTERGCPWDCGLCPDHEQHSCLAIVEINEACNLACPVCFADSSPKRNSHRSLGRGRVHARRPGEERRRARPGADLGRRAHHPSADPRHPRCRAAPSHQARDAEHQRHPHRRGPGLLRRAGRAAAGLRGLPAVRFAERRCAQEHPRRRADAHPPPGAGQSRGAQHFDDPGLHGEARRQRHGDRRDRAPCAEVQMRARHQLPARAGRRPQRRLRSEDQPHRAVGDPPPHRRGLRRVRRRRHDPACPAIPPRSRSATACATARR